ncbi:hypothetical protein KCU81_g10030, partial [Aureobasidium melanogenum]|uniref:Uncharacterized protein n=2 Tax=Aureobasidium melanogenum TaxID=46634 RepID=A0A074VAS0_AURM1
MFMPLHHSAGVHIKEPIEKHLTQASDDVTRIIDFAPIVERFALQGFSNMASGQTWMNKTSHALVLPSSKVNGGS